jgi:predicted transcriptional regulator
MAKKKEEKTRVVNLYVKPTTFSSIFKRLKGEKSEYDFSGLSDLRKLLSNEKAKILNIIKERNPKSIYGLAKMLKRDFKAVRDDVTVLEKFGFIELKQESKGKRKRLRPVVGIDKLQINVSFE